MTERVTFFSKAGLPALVALIALTPVSGQTETVASEINHQQGIQSLEQERQRLSLRREIMEIERQIEEIESSPEREEQRRRESEADDEEISEAERELEQEIEVLESQRNEMHAAMQEFQDGVILEVYRSQSDQYMKAVLMTHHGPVTVSEGETIRGWNVDRIALNEVLLTHKELDQEIRLGHY